MFFIRNTFALLVGGHICYFFLRQLQASSCLSPPSAPTASSIKTFMSLFTGMRKLSRVISSEKSGIILGFVGVNRFYFPTSDIWVTCWFSFQNMFIRRVECAGFSFNGFKFAHSLTLSITNNLGSSDCCI